MSDDMGANHLARHVLSTGLEERPGTGRAVNALTASALLHATALLAVLLLIARAPGPQLSTARLAPTEGLIWTTAAGTAGGGGGGNRRPEPSQVAEAPGAEKLAVRVAAARTAVSRSRCASRSR